MPTVKLNVLASDILAFICTVVHILLIRKSTSSFSAQPKDGRILALAQILVTTAIYTPLMD